MAINEDILKAEREEAWRKEVRDSIKPKDRMALARVKMLEV